MAIYHFMRKQPIEHVVGILYKKERPRWWGRGLFDVDIIDVIVILDLPHPGSSCHLVRRGLRPVVFAIQSILSSHIWIEGRSKHDRIPRTTQALPPGLLWSLGSYPIDQLSWYRLYQRGLLSHHSTGKSEDAPKEEVAWQSDDRSLEPHHSICG